MIGRVPRWPWAYVTFGLCIAVQIGICAWTLNNQHTVTVTARGQAFVCAPVGK